MLNFIIAVLFIVLLQSWLYTIRRVGTRIDVKNDLVSFAGSIKSDSYMISPPKTASNKKEQLQKALSPVVLVGIDSSSSRVDFHDRDSDIRIQKLYNYKQLNLDRFTSSGNSALNTNKNDYYECPKGLIKINYDRILSKDITHYDRRIPKVIHMTSKSRCMIPEYANNVQKWSETFVDHSFYFHDDNAVDAFLRSNEKYHEHYFPGLFDVQRCITNGATKSDIWRYLLLWEFGGIYADIDSKPTAKFHSSYSSSSINGNNTMPIQSDDDSFFLVDGSTNTGDLSQYFIASSIRHPLIHGTLNNAINNLRSSVNVMINNAALKTGPRALKGSFHGFLHNINITASSIFNPPEYKTSDRKIKIDQSDEQINNNNVVRDNHNRVRIEIYSSDNQNWDRSATILGSRKNPKEYIIRDTTEPWQKMKLYKLMNMTHHHDDIISRLPKTGRISCEEHIRRTINTTKVANYKFDKIQNTYVDADKEKSSDRESVISSIEATTMRIKIKSSLTTATTTIINENGKKSESKETIERKCRYKKIKIEDFIWAVNNDEKNDSVIKCSDGLIPINYTVIKNQREQQLPPSTTANNIHNDDHQYSKIPKIIHMTSKSRCLVQEYYNNIRSWSLQFPNHYVYYWDDYAIKTFLQSNQQYYSYYFPQLLDVGSCITNGATLSDIFRYLVLWEYGGIYADIDSEPSKKEFSIFEMIEPNIDDSFFVMDGLGIISQYFMASSPRHPLIEKTLTIALSNLRKTVNVMVNNPALNTGPKALKTSFDLFINTDEHATTTTGVTTDTAETTKLSDYMYDRINDNKNRMYILDSNSNRSITIVGHKNKPQQYIIRDSAGFHSKKKYYTLMNMTHHHEESHRFPRKNRISCEEHIRFSAPELNDTSNINSNNNKTRRIDFASYYYDEEKESYIAAENEGN